MKKLFIYGSCVTRDALPYFEDVGYGLVDYVARQSLISSFRPVPIDSFDLSKIVSPFQRRMMEGDIVGNLRFRIQRTQPDLLVWDICDERLGVQKVPGSGVISCLRDVVAEGVHPGPLGQRFHFGEDEHFVLWSKAADQFASVLDRYGVRDKLIFNWTPWAERDENGVDFNGQAEKARRFNSAAMRYVQRITDLGLRVASLDQTQVASRSDGHKWGPAPFHYTEETYRRMINTVVDALV